MSEVFEQFKHSTEMVILAISQQGIKVTRPVLERRSGIHSRDRRGKNKGYLFHAMLSRSQNIRIIKSKTHTIYNYIGQSTIDKVD